MSTRADRTFGTIWVSGASSGIGAAFVAAVPGAGSKVIGISRRPGRAEEHLAADLSDPSSWSIVEDSFAAELAPGGDEGALFFHCAGTTDPSGPMIDAGVAEYRRGVILNSAAGQVLGRAFLASATSAGVPATVVMCSSPGAHKPGPGVTHYSGGKAAIEQWARSAAAEFGDASGEPRIFSVIPYATDTAMVRGLMEESAEDVPVSDYFRAAAASGDLASPERVATEIWAAIESGAGSGEAIAVGATGLAE